MMHSCCVSSTDDMLIKSIEATAAASSAPTSVGTDGSYT